ncbi:MAG: hypothetical protein MI743_10760 [Sneathiellales bacterium]|nr:hypothetical protein [Sneathiellales bacterium]
MKYLVVIFACLLSLATHAKDFADSTELKGAFGVPIEKPIKTTDCADKQ